MCKGDVCILSETVKITEIKESVVFFKVTGNNAVENMPKSLFKIVYKQLNNELLEKLKKKCEKI